VFFRVEELRVVISSTEKKNISKTAARCGLVDSVYIVQLPTDFKCGLPLELLAV
jgi:hypothetical protein